jgi:hypothetical protein
MTIEQHDNMINTIRGYDFAFKATGEDNYRVTRDKLLKALNELLEANNNVIELKAVA